MKRLLLILLVIIPFTLNAQDFELWGTIKVDGGLTSKLSLVLEEEARYNYDNAEVRYTHTEFGLLYSVHKNIKLGLFYRDIYENKNNEVSKISVPHGDVIFSKSGFKFRTRVEYIHKYGNYEDIFRYRLRPGYQTSIWENYNPFVQNELFFTSEEVTRNRLNVGVTYKLGPFQIQPGYLWETNNKGVWSNRHILWVNTKVKF